MNNLKSYFVVIYMVLAVTIMLSALAQILSHGLSLIWLGTFLTAMPFVTLYAWARFLKKTARSSRYLPIPTLITVAGLALSIYGYVQAEAVPYTGIGLSAAAIGTLGFLLYVNWYSIFNRRVSDKLSMGKQLPSFEAQQPDGESVNSDVLLGKPALLLFYRGGWCPICMAQVDEVASRYRGLIDRGVQVVLISPQPPDLTRRVAEMYDVAFNFWVDVDSQAAAALGIINKDGVPIAVRKRYGADTVLPTAIITDAAGKIIFTDQTNNYRVRPNPDFFIDALSEHGY
jgi:peroxiredoxin